MAVKPAKVYGGTSDRDAQCAVTGARTPTALEEILRIMEQGNCYEEDVWFIYRLLCNIRNRRTLR